MYNYLHVVMPGLYSKFVEAKKGNHNEADPFIEIKPPKSQKKIKDLENLEPNAVQVKT